MKALELFRKLFRSRQSLTIEERITLSLVSESEAALLPAHQRRLYNKWKTKRESK